MLLLTLLLLLGAITDGLEDRWPRAPVAFATADSLLGRVAPGERDSTGAIPPGAGESSGTIPVTSAGAADSAGRLDINRATARELDGLPGVGPVLAARILEHRARYGAFREPSDLRAVRGIGPKLFARIEGRIRIGPQALPRR